MYTTAPIVILEWVSYNQYGRGKEELYNAKLYLTVVTGVLSEYGMLVR